MSLGGDLDDIFNFLRDDNDNDHDALQLQLPLTGMPLQDSDSTMTAPDAIPLSIASVSSNNNSALNQNHTNSGSAGGSSSIPLLSNSLLHLPTPNSNPSTSLLLNTDSSSLDNLMVSSDPMSFPASASSAASASFGVLSQTLISLDGQSSSASSSMPNAAANLNLDAQLSQQQLAFQSLAIQSNEQGIGTNGNGAAGQLLTNAFLFPNTNRLTAPSLSLTMPAMSASSSASSASISHPPIPPTISIADQRNIYSTSPSTTAVPSAFPNQLRPISNANNGQPFFPQLNANGNNNNDNSYHGAQTSFAFSQHSVAAPAMGMANVVLNSYIPASQTHTQSAAFSISTLNGANGHLFNTVAVDKSKDKEDKDKEKKKKNKKDKDRDKDKDKDREKEKHKKDKDKQKEKEKEKKHKHHHHHHHEKDKDKDRDREKDKMIFAPSASSSSKSMSATDLTRLAQKKTPSTSDLTRLAQKKVNRLQRKAELARQSRRRKKAHLYELEQQVQVLTAKIQFILAERAKDGLASSNDIPEDLLSGVQGIKSAKKSGDGDDDDDEIAELDGGQGEGNNNEDDKDSDDDDDEQDLDTDHALAQDHHMVSAAVSAMKSAEDVAYEREELNDPLKPPRLHLVRELESYLQRITASVLPGAEEQLTLYLVSDGAPKPSPTTSEASTSPSPSLPSREPSPTLQTLNQPAMQIPAAQALLQAASNTNAFGEVNANISAAATAPSGGFVNSSVLSFLNSALQPDAASRSASADNRQRANQTPSPSLPPSASAVSSTASASSSSLDATQLFELVCQHLSLSSSQISRMSTLQPAIAAELNVLRPLLKEVSDLESVVRSHIDLLSQVCAAVCAVLNDEQRVRLGQWLEKNQLIAHMLNTHWMPSPATTQNHPSQPANANITTPTNTNAAMES